MTTERRKMDIPQILFTFRGRITRSEFWLKGLLIVLPINIGCNILVHGTDNDGAHIVALVTAIIMLYPLAALYVKRLHDLDSSGWMLLFLLIPIVNLIYGIWLIVQTWFFRGTVGYNRFGEDPLHKPPCGFTSPVAVTMAYHISQDGRHGGPYELTQLRELWRSGAISPDSLYWFEGAQEWQPITKLSRLLSS